MLLHSTVILVVKPETSHWWYENPAWYTAFFETLQGIDEDFYTNCCSIFCNNYFKTGGDNLFDI
jgi:hypothetical protein